MSRPEFPSEPIRDPGPPEPRRAPEPGPGEAVCPSCGGTGGSVAFVCRVPRSASTREWLACPFCTAEGKVELARSLAWIEGQRRRRDRVGRGLSQREEAERLGITQRELRDIEQGEA